MKVKKHPPVTIERTPLKKGDSGWELEVKRFCVPGTVLKTTCPKCGGAYKVDFDEDYLSYPTVGKPFKERFYCYAPTDDVGGVCEHEWEVLLQLDVVLTAPTSSKDPSDG